MGVIIYNPMDLEEVNKKKEEKDVEQSLIFAEIFEKQEKDKMEIMQAIAEAYETLGGLNND